MEGLRRALANFTPGQKACVVGLGMIAGGVVLWSCGRQGNESRQPVSAVTDAPAASPMAVVPAAALGAPVLTKSETEESVPPDLDVSPVDTLVAPGQLIDFNVRTTSDVTRLALSDGRDEPLAFVREAGTDRWSVTYRVPLKPRVERWGVSITARTDAQRWRRVWVFLSVHDGREGAAVNSSADSTTGTAQ